MLQQIDCEFCVSEYECHFLLQYHILLLSTYIYTKGGGGAEHFFLLIHIK